MISLADAGAGTICTTRLGYSNPWQPVAASPVYSARPLPTESLAGMIRGERNAGDVKEYKRLLKAISSTGCGVRRPLRAAYVADLPYERSARDHVVQAMPGISASVLFRLRHRRHETFEQEPAVAGGGLQRDLHD